MPKFQWKPVGFWGAPKSAQWEGNPLFSAKTWRRQAAPESWPKPAPNAPIWGPDSRRLIFRRFGWQNWPKFQGNSVEVSGAPKPAQWERVLLFFRPKPGAGRRRPNLGRNPLQMRRFGAPISGAWFLGDLAGEIGRNFGGTLPKFRAPRNRRSGSGFCCFFGQNLAPAGGARILAETRSKRTDLGPRFAPRDF